jgi:hypothetical protein
VNSGKSPTRCAIRRPNRSAGSALTRWPVILTSLVAVRDPVRGANRWSVRIDGTGDRRLAETRKKLQGQLEGVVSSLLDDLSGLVYALVIP